MLRVLCLLASLTASLTAAIVFNVTLTPSGVARYNTSNPLLVEISDSIRFTCNGSVSNVLILASRQQWQTCNATTGGAPFQWAYCLDTTSTKTVSIIHQSNTVAGTYSFDEGQDYYLASFSDGTLTGAYNGGTSGGECLSGVKMVISVGGFRSPSPSITSSTITSSFTITSSHHYTNGMLPSTNSPTTPISGTGSQGSDAQLPGNMTALSDRADAGHLLTTVVPAVSTAFGVVLIGGGALLVLLIVVGVRRQKRSDVKDKHLEMGQDPTGSLRSYTSRQGTSDSDPLTCRDNTSMTSEPCKEMTSITSVNMLLGGVASQ